MQFQVLFAIRSGGHTPHAGFASIGEPGILLDMSRLDAISVNDDASVVSTGPGQRWGGVVEAADAYNVTVVSGRLSSLGVGGLLVGGECLVPCFRTGYGRINVRPVEYLF